MKFLKIVAACSLAAALAGCATTYPARLKIHTDPEGAHVVFKEGNSQWIYLGTTPLESIQTIDKEKIKANDSISIKTMRCGYLDQVKDWKGEQFEDEVDEKGVIFWTPRLIKNAE